MAAICAFVAESSGGTRQRPRRVPVSVDVTCDSFCLCYANHYDLDKHLFRLPLRTPRLPVTAFELNARRCRAAPHVFWAKVKKKKKKRNAQNNNGRCNISATGHARESGEELGKLRNQQTRRDGPRKYAVPPFRLKYPQEPPLFIHVYLFIYLF